MHTVAMLAVYSDPHPTLLLESSGTFLSCTFEENRLFVADVGNIDAVVAMIPHEVRVGNSDPEKRWFVVEKPGLDIANMDGYAETAGEE